MQWSYLESFQDSPSPYLKKKSFSNPTQQKVCTSLGEKYNPTTDTCVPCEEGTYQNTINHTLTSCKPHVEPVCDTGFYLDTATYTTRKNDTKESTVDLSGLCVSHPSLEDLRKQCSNGYILDTNYNDIINTDEMKKSPLTLTKVCKPHTTWDTKTTLGTCNEKQYYDRIQYNDIINKEKSRNITLDEICSTIPYYPLNVKDGDDNYRAKPNLRVFLKESDKYLDIQSLNDLRGNLELNLIPSDNAKSIPITWNKETNKILMESTKEVKKIRTIMESKTSCYGRPPYRFCRNFSIPKVLTETTPIKYYAKVVDNKIKFVEESNELSVDMRNDKLFVTGTNIEIVVNNCEDNQYFDNQSRQCKPKTNSCGKGTYFSGYGNSAISNDPKCTPCGAGTYQDLTGQSSCKSCGTGTYQDLTGQSSCKSCGTGTYQDLTGQSSCKSCGTGTYQNYTGQTSCKSCGTGTYQDLTRQSSCKSCGAGTYQNYTGQTSCKSCGAGTYQDLTGQSRCKSCGTGTYQNYTRQTSCKSCGAGTYQDLTRQSSCKSCGAGTYQNYTRQTSCKSCGPGTYQDLTRQSSCKSCGAGTYQNYKGQSSCISCPGGTYQLHSRKTSINDCKKTFHIIHIDGSRVGFRINGKVLSEFEIRTKKQSGKYWIRIYPKGSNVTKHESGWRFSNISGDDYASQSHTIVKHDTNNEIFYIMARHSYRAPHWYVLAVVNNRLVWKDAYWWKNNNRACMFHFKYITHNEYMTHGTVQALAAHRVNNTTYNVTYNDNYWGRHGNFIGYPV